jgi:hypothetical protein
MTEITHTVFGENSENLYGCGYSDTDGSASIFKFNTEQRDLKWHQKMDGDNTDICRGVFHNPSESVVYALIESMSSEVKYVASGTTIDSLLIKIEDNGLLGTKTDGRQITFMSYD